MHHIHLKLNKSHNEEILYYLLKIYFKKQTNHSLKIYKNKKKGKTFSAA